MYRREKKMLPLRVDSGWVVGLCPQEHQSNIFDVCVINGNKIARIHANAAIAVRDGRWMWEVFLEMKDKVSVKFLSSDYDKINNVVYTFLQGDWDRESYGKFICRNS